MREKLTERARRHKLNSTDKSVQHLNKFYLAALYKNMVVSFSFLLLLLLLLIFTLSIQLYVVHVQ